MEPIKYPVTLLPRIGFKKIECDLGDYYLIRQTPFKDIINPNTERIKDEALTDDDYFFLDYSINLLGHFTKEENKIYFQSGRKKSLTTNWDFVSAVEIPIHKIDFDVNDSFGYFFLKIDTLKDKLNVPYNRNKEVNVMASVTIIHTPTVSNFWHFEIHWLDNDKKIISRSEKKWKNTFVATIRSFISEFIILEVEGSKLLSEEHYIESVADTQDTVA